MRKSIVLAFGRMNPPTKGHLKLVNKMAEVARKYNCPAELYLSHSQDQLRNPLSYDSKVYWVDKAFGNKVDVVESEARTVFEILKDLYSEGYTDVIYVGGADRIGGAEDISRTILRYNGTPNKSGEVPYNFESIKFVNAGIRDDSSNDITERASASAARAAVVNGNFEGFKQLVPFNESDADNLFRQIYSIMVDEELPESLYNFVTNGVLDESLITEDKITVKGNDYQVKKSGSKYIINVGDDRFIDKFRNLFDGPISVDIPSLEISNEVFDDYKVSEGEPASNGGTRGKLTINKNGRSIDIFARKGTVKGQSTGQFTEALVCYYYNNGLDAEQPLYEGSPVDISEDWKTSIDKTVTLMKNEWPNGYTAVQIDGITFGVVDSNAVTISKIFKDKRLAGEIIAGNPKAFQDLYFGGKDNWSKADILLVKKGITSDIFHGIDTCEALDDKIKELSQSVIIPISLKMIEKGSNGSIDYIIPAKQKENIEGIVNIILPKKTLKEDSVNASCYLYSEGKKIQFRSQSGLHATLSIEVLYGAARGGKPLSNLKNDLKLKNDFYDFTINSEEELISELENIVGPGNIIGLENMKKQPEGWYNRVCFRGLIGLYNEYKEHVEDATPQIFMAWIYNAATTTPTPFYIIK